jgi:hypothetical protein
MSLIFKMAVNFLWTELWKFSDAASGKIAERGVTALPRFCQGAIRRYGRLGP